MSRNGKPLTIKTPLVEFLPIHLDFEGIKRMLSDGVDEAQDSSEEEVSSRSKFNGSESIHRILFLITCARVVQTCMILKGGRLSA